MCEYSRSRSFHDDLILQDQASGERSQDQWSSGSSFLQLHKRELWKFDMSYIVHVYGLFKFCWQLEFE